VDRLIIHALSGDARMTCAELGAKVGLSESQCLRRLRALERTKVIQRYVTLIDPIYLNLRISAFIEVRLHDANDAQIKTFERVLEQRPDVGSWWRTAGEADYLIRGIVADPSGYERLLDGLAEVDGVEIIRTHCVLRVLKASSQLPFCSTASTAAMGTALETAGGNGPQHDGGSVSRSPASVKLPGITARDTASPRLDDVDRRILRTLVNNARMSNAQLAESVSLSAAPCLRRVRALEAAGVILGYQAVVDFDALALIVFFVLIRLKAHNPEWQRNFERAVSGIPEIVLAHRTMGASDYVLRCVTHGLGGVDQLLRDKIFTGAPIDSVRSALCLRYGIPDLQKFHDPKDSCQPAGGGQCRNIAPLARRR
jgi:Lrp/AsnC family leucine-responsive transcriptional regulator